MAAKKAENGGERRSPKSKGHRSGAKRRRGRPPNAKKEAAHWVAPPDGAATPNVRPSEEEFRALCDELDNLIRRSATWIPQPPPISPSISTEPISSDAVVPVAGALKGGTEVDFQSLHRAFSILMDLMEEAADETRSKVSPACVSQTATKFVKLMEGYRRERQKAASWVRGHEMVQGFKEFYSRAARDWPSRATDSQGAQRVPVHQASAERVALTAQKEALEALVRSFGFDNGRDDVKRAVERSLATREQIRHVQSGPQKAAFEAVARFCALNGPSLGGSSMEHYLKTKSHFERTAAGRAPRFTLPEDAPCVSSRDVQAGLAVAQMARAYYLRYLMDEQVKRLRNGELGEVYSDDELRWIAAKDLRVPPSAQSPMVNTPGSLAEIAAWDERTMRLILEGDSSPNDDGETPSEGVLTKEN